MRGTKSAPKRTLMPDVQHNSTLVTKLINYLTIDGKKSTAQAVVYKALKDLEAATQRPGAEALQVAVTNVSPQVEVRSKRVGGATYQVPSEVRADRKITLALRWIRESSNKRKGVPMHTALKDELLDAYNSTGASMKKREDLHKMAEANKAFAHFARF